MNTARSSSNDALPVQPAHQLPVHTEAQRWLVTDLWLENAVGLIGGEPKCYKSFLALDLAVAVASGAACLRRYGVPRPGPVLLYAAEDALHIVRHRLEGICAAAGCSLQRLDLQVITVPTLRWICPPIATDCNRRSSPSSPDCSSSILSCVYIASMKMPAARSPRCWRICVSCNAGTSSRCSCPSREKGGGRIRAGQALRGSSEFHAWGDSNLYMRRLGNDLTLTVEHRAAASMAPITLELVQREHALALQLRTSSKPEGPASNPIDERITQALEAAGRSLPVAELRELCRVRNATLHDRLTALTRTGQLLRDSHGYRLAPSA